MKIIHILSGTNWRIPHKPEHGCPLETFGCTGETCKNTKTCFCGQHCSWDRCRLQHPPDDCLNGVNSKWKWNSRKIHWVAQFKGKAIIYIHNQSIDIKMSVSYIYLYNSRSLT